MANAYPPSDSGWDVGFSSKSRFRALINLLVVGEFGWNLVVQEHCGPPRRILASLSFPRSGSGFREAAVVGGRAACPPAPAHPPLTAALKFALLPLPPSLPSLPPTRAECQRGPVAAASAPPSSPSAHLGASGAEAGRVGPEERRGL